jgi:hypothetical protein
LYFSFSASSRFISTSFIILLRVSKLEDDLADESRFMLDARELLRVVRRELEPVSLLINPLILQKSQQTKQLVKTRLAKEMLVVSHPKLVGLRVHRPEIDFMIVEFSDRTSPNIF